MKIHELRQLIRKEVRRVMNEKKVPKKGTADYHQHKIALDTVKNPNKAFFGGMDSDEAVEILKKKFGYSDSEIKKLHENKNSVDYYQYETPKIVVKWNGKVQGELGRFKKANDALMAIKKYLDSLQGISAPSTKGWVIQTPDADLKVDDYLQYKSGKWVQLREMVGKEVKRVLKEGAVRAIYIHKLDYDKADEIRMKNKLSVVQDVGGSRGGVYAVNAPSGYDTFEKSLDDSSGKDWEKFVKLVKAAGLRYKELFVRVLYIHKQDYDKANEIRMKKKLSVAEDDGGSKGGIYAVNAPSGYATFQKSPNDPGGKDWEEFIKLVKASGLRYKQIVN